jgi:putative tryptophan/tyrosine transport system substrate-binding protein
MNQSRILDLRFSTEKTKRKAVFLLALITLLRMVGSVADAEPAKIPRLGFLGGTRETDSSASNFKVFRQALQSLGYVEGKSIAIEYRNAVGNVELIPGLVSELVQLKVDVLFTTNPTAIRAAKKATKTIPIVMVTSEDPVATGIIDSLARTGGNITGLTILTRDLGGKRLELLKEMLPPVSRVGVLLPADSTIATNDLREYEAAALTQNIKLQSLEVRGPNPDFDSAFQAASQGGASAVIALRNSLINNYAKRIATLAIKNRLSLMFERSAYVDAGGLVSYANSDAESFKRAAVFVDKILKGTKPADLPVEQPTKFELVINLKTAKQIGLTIPANVLARADRVIR